MLWTTPESVQEKLPLVHRAGDLAITADARLDNRDELIQALSLTGRPAMEIADSQLILAAYEKWGVYCPEKLLGVFAFAIWDRQKRWLFCARDHFGVKPFYYYSSNRCFVFASEIKALFSLPGVPRRLNDVRVAEYMTSLFDDTAITFYQDILRLPPAHCMMVSNADTTLRTYWALEPAREIRLPSDEAYAEAFRELFSEAIRPRLRRALPLASLLSGGLDSSSVTCVARNLLRPSDGYPLSTFSAIFDEVGQCDERPFIHTVLTQGGLEPHYVRGDVSGPLTHLDHMFWHQDEPFFAPGLFLSWQLYGAVHQQGIRILLDGHDGDSTVSHGYGYPGELAQEGRWLTLAIEVRGLARLYGESFWKGLWSYAWGYKLDPVISRSKVLSYGLRTWRGLRRQGRWSHRLSANRPAWQAILNPDFVERIGLAERYRAWQQAQAASARSERLMHHRLLTSGIQPFALEVLDKAAAAFVLEPRYPFWDKRLVEFCLALPPEQKLHRGWSRMVLRRAMAGVLPAEVQWRPTKLDFSPNVRHGLLTIDRERLDEIILKDATTIEEYVDIPALREAYQRFVSQQSPDKSQDVFAIWKAVSLALWLRYVNNEKEVL
jgi:asparagine synthase (glutamine-hydrolysing)